MNIQKSIAMFDSALKNNNWTSKLNKGQTLGQSMHLKNVKKEELYFERFQKTQEQIAEINKHINIDILCPELKDFLPPFSEKYEVKTISLNQLAKELGENHPMVKEGRNKILEIRKKIASIIEKRNDTKI